jgi:hypothetical protein
MADQTHFLTGGTGSFGEKPRSQEKPLAEQSQEELGIKLTATAKRLAPVKPEQPTSRVSQAPKETRKYEIAKPVAAEPTTAEATALSDAQTKELKEKLDTITSTYLRTIDLSRKGKERHSLTKGAVDIENLVKEGGNVPVRVVVDSEGNVLVGEIIEGELEAISGGVSSVEMSLKELGSKLRKNQVVDVDELTVQRGAKKVPGELPKFMQDVETEIKRRRRQSNKE